MSPDLRDVIAATIPSVLPTLMVLYGIMSNKNDINQVRTSISEVRSEMGAMRSQFHADINSLRSDIATLVNVSNEMDKRVSRLEDKG